MPTSAYQVQILHFVLQLHLGEFPQLIFVLLNLTRSHQLSARSKGKFRTIQTSTAFEYGNTATRAIAYALRYEAALTNSNSEEDGPSTPALIAPFWKENQHKLVSEFLQSLVLDSHETTDDDIAVFVHKFLASSFTAVFSVTKPVDSILEQTAVFKSFSDISGWKKPSALINSVLKGFQYVSKAVLIHSGFLGSFSAIYTAPPESNTNSEDEEGSNSSTTPDESSSEDDENENESDEDDEDEDKSDEDEDDEEDAEDSDDEEDQEGWDFMDVTPVVEAGDSSEKITR